MKAYGIEGGGVGAGVGDGGDGGGGVGGDEGVAALGSGALATLRGPGVVGLADLQFHSSLTSPHKDG